MNKQRSEYAANAQMLDSALLAKTFVGSARWMEPSRVQSRKGQQGTTSGILKKLFKFN